MSTQTAALSEILKGGAGTGDDCRSMSEACRQPFSPGLPAHDFGSAGRRQPSRPQTRASARAGFEAGSEKNRPKYAIPSLADALASLQVWKPVLSWEKAASFFW